MMHRLRLWTIILIAWLLFIVNVEQSSEKFLDIGRSSDANIIEWYSYILIAAVVLTTLIVPVLRNPPLRVALPAIVTLFLAAKLYFKSGDAWTVEDVLRAATELSAIVLTLLLTRQLSQALDEFQAAVAAITIPKVGKSVEDAFSASEGEMYQEVRRARQYNRPLALLALRIEGEPSSVALQQVIIEAQQAMIDELLLAGVAGALCDELRDYDIIGRHADCFLVLLPELTKEDVPNVIFRLRNAVSERVKVKLEIGAVTFPDNASTFDGLVQQAIQQIEISPGATYPTAVTQTQTMAHSHLGGEEV
jgi:GGDEF domain-containing protein